MTSASVTLPQPVPSRTAAVAQAARIRARVRCSDPLARVLRELAFGLCPDDGFVAAVPTSEPRQ